MKMLYEKVYLNILLILACLVRLEMGKFRYYVRDGYVQVLAGDGCI